MLNPSDTVERDVTIINRLGLHARAAAKFVQTASEFDANVNIIKNDAGHEKTVNGKSILGVMMLAAAKGTTVTLSATGHDAQAAIDAIETLITDKFGEGE